MTKGLGIALSAGLSDVAADHYGFVLSRFGQETHLDILRGKFQMQLEEIIESYEGVAGVHVLDLTNGDRFAADDELIFPQASAIKIPILLELFRRQRPTPESSPSASR